MPYPRRATPAFSVTSVKRTYAFHRQRTVRVVAEEARAPRAAGAPIARLNEEDVQIAPLVVIEERDAGAHDSGR